MLADLEELARRVRHSGTDKKWTELRDLLSDNTLIRDSDGSIRKIIIFTEHRDTLDYLAERIRGLLGRPEAVVDHPRRGPARGTPQGHGAVHPGRRTAGCWSPPTPRARA